MSEDRDLTPMQRSIAAYAEEKFGKRRAQQYLRNAKARNADNERHLHGETLAQYRNRCNAKPPTLAQIYAANAAASGRNRREPIKDRWERQEKLYAEWLKERDRKRSAGNVAKQYGVMPPGADHSMECRA